MKLTSLCFLHQARQSLLTTCEMKIKILHLIAFFTKTAIDALNNFYFKKDFSKFDPHVGETLCQIRAYKIVMLSSKVRDKVKLIAVQSEIKRLGSFYRLTKERLAFFQMELISGNSQSQKEIASHTCLDVFLEENGLVFELSSDVFYLMQAYFLTIFKSLNNNEDTYLDHEKICKTMNIARKLSKKIVHYYQSNLAKDSSEYIFRLANELPNQNLAFPLNDLKQVDDDDRIVLPCYIATKILLENAIKHGIKILLVVQRRYEGSYDYNQVFILYEPSQYGDTFEQ